MKAYIHVSDSFVVEVEVKNSLIYENEIIIGGTRVTLYGMKRTDIYSISIFPGVKSFAKVETPDYVTWLGTIEKTSRGIVLSVE